MDEIEKKIQLNKIQNKRNSNKKMRTKFDIKKLKSNIEG
jgi:hypothetical protein